MHKIEQALQIFVENLGKQPVDEKLIEAFGENCKKALRDCFLDTSKEEAEFGLRMSNIGKPLRQILLEKIHGRTPMDSQQRLRMTYGYIWESLLLFFLQAAGLDIEQGKQVSLDIPYASDGTLKLNGTMDIKIDGKVYDIKSASSWSYDNKFNSVDSLEEDDPFGYVGQGMAYALADGCTFGGWIVIDKSDGRIKVLEVTDEKFKSWIPKYTQDFKDKALAVATNAEPPPCEGVVDERFNRRETGNKCLTKPCEFCPHKYKCHPGLVYAPETHSQAKTRKWKYYTHIEKPTHDS
jgi:hypothetical protein